MARDVRVKIVGDPASFKKAIKESNSSLDTFEKKADLAGKATHRLNTAAIAFTGGLVSGAGLVEGVKKAIDAASNLHEQINKSEVVFGTASKSVLAWSKDTATSLGIAQDKAIEYAATFGNMLKPMGFAEQKAGEMSKSLVNLAADMASFNNASPEQTLAALQSGLAGQVRPLRQFGVFLDQARIKQEALNLHLYSGKGNLDAAAKAAASYAIILKDTKDAQGDFARTSGGLANQQRILKAQLGDLEAEIGTKLMPVVLKIVTHVNKWTHELLTSKRAHQDLQDALDGMKKTLQVSIGAWKTFSDSVGGTKTAMELLVGVLIASKFAAALDNTTALGKSIRGIPANKTVKITVGVVFAAGAYKVLKSIYGEAFGADFSGASSAGDSNPVWDASMKKWVDPNTGKAVQDQAYWNKQFKANGGHGRPSDGQNAYGHQQGSTVQGGVIAAAKSAMGNAYSYGGAPSLSKPTDCSGLMVAAFAKENIRLPRTSQEQYAQAPIKNARPLLPGDLVFSEGVHPGHVGLYIGDNQVLEDPHTGDHVKIVALSAFGWNGESARWWGGTNSSSGGGGGSDTSHSSASATPPPTGTTSAASGKTKKVSGSKLLSDSVRGAIADAKSTRALDDDIAALKRARAELEKKPQTVPVKEELGAIKKQIHDLEDRKLKQKLDAQKKVWAEHGKAVKHSIDAQTKAWKAAVDELQKIADRAAARASRSFQEASALAFRNFDRATALGLAGLDADRANLTPAEQALKDREDARAAKARADAISSAQSDLDKAMADGDPEAIKAAQAALDAALYDQQTFDLEQQAAKERAARDKDYADREQAFQDYRDAQRQALQDWLDDEEQALKDGRISWDQFYDDLKDKAKDGGFDSGKAFWDAWNQAGKDAEDARKKAAAAGNGAKPVEAGGWKGFVDSNGVPVSAGFSGFDANGNWVGPAFADGVQNFRGGLALVGERGPELVSLPGGSSVTPNGAGLTADVPVVVQIGEDALFTAVQRVTLRNKLRNGRNGLG